jgi:hypothetical protein
MMVARFERPARLPAEVTDRAKFLSCDVFDHVMV